MKLIFQPLKQIWVNQAFGENEVCINDDRELIGCDGNNPPTGYRSLYGSKGHLGVDLAAWRNAPVNVAQEGTVYYLDTNERSGLDVRISSEVKGRKFRHIYEHLSSIAVAKGDYVKTGVLLGRAGDTGYAKGVHLHLEVHELILGVWTPIDPMTIMEDIQATQMLAWNNTILYATEIVAKLADDIADFIRRSSAKKADY